MKSRWDDGEAKRFVDRYREHGEDLALRVYTSRLLGADPRLVLHGGGNTSVKASAREITGENVDALYVKGSGWDLAAIEPKGFPACRLAALWRLCELSELSDEQMVAGLRGQMIDPSSPTPSVEALLHAFLPAKYVDHTHADAVLSVVDQPDGEARAKEAWGDDVFFVPYVMPGFYLARKIVEMKDHIGKTSLMVLDKHGIFSWGSSARESYERMIDGVSAAEAVVSRAMVSVPPPTTRLGTAAERLGRQAELSPLIRGALARAEDGRRLVVDWRDDDDILGLLARQDAEKQTQIGTATPDHVIRTKAFPVWLGELDSEEPRQAVESALSQFATWYQTYFDRGVKRTGRNLERLDRLPRLLAVPGVGVACVGKTITEARVAGDIYTHTARIILDALAIGEYRPLPLEDLFELEYWSLEQAKLKRAAKVAGPLADRIALVTGAAGGIGRATAAHFLELGAHVVASDRDADRLATTHAELAERHGKRVAQVAADVTDDDDVKSAFAFAARTFGGVDVVVSNAGSAPSGLLHTDAGSEALARSLELNLVSHQRVARAAADQFLSQGLGGCLLFNASKSAFNQGPEFGPYAVPKAGVIALMRQYAVDLGREGVRANAVNADRIRTDLFGGGVLEARAKARGVSPDEYFEQNLLGRETTGRDVAQAFASLAVAEATTGCVVTVDGGNAAAFPR